jgi:hypothetical protein
MPRLQTLLAVLTLASAACVATPRTVSLRIEGNVDEALVTVDDQVVGTVAAVEKRGVALPPGTHRITVEQSGYFPHDELVQVKEGDPLLRLKIEMEKIPD